MNPSEASKPHAGSGSSAQDQAGNDESTELLIRVPIRDQEGPDGGPPEPAKAPPQRTGPAQAAARGTAPAGGRKQTAPASQARPLFAAVAAGPRESVPEGFDRARSGPPAEPDAATRIRFARLHLRTGSLMTARVQYEALAANNDLDVPGLLDLAEVRWRTADLPGAGAAAAEYLSKEGDQALGFLIAAEAAARAGRQVEARRSAEIAAERLGKDLNAIFAGLPRRLNWAGVTPGPAPVRPVAIKIETPPRPQSEAAPQEPVSQMVSPEALWAQIVEVAQAADQAGTIADEKAARTPPHAAPGPQRKPAPEPVAESAPAPEPVAESAPEPEPEPEAVVEPAPAPEPVVESAAEPEAVVEPAPAPEPAVESAPAPEPAVESAPAPEPAVESVAEPEAAPEPVVEPELASEPVVESAAEPAPAPEPVVAAPAVKPEARPWDESIAAGTAALEVADPLLAALHYAVALRMSPQAAPAVLEAIGDRRDLALELVRVDALRVAAEAADAEAAAAAPQPATAPQAPEPPKPEPPVRHAAPEPPPIRWE